ncbi:hypothetical protein LTR85_007833 [Meristemomyces frigidus]|nr:hypothetical protein LTR85_007833 [Meristemomyces frigidus]
MRAGGIRPAEGEEPEAAPDNPYSEPGDDQPGGTGYHPSTSDGGSSTGESDGGSAQTAEGTSQQDTNPFDNNEESEENEELIEKILDAVKDVLEQIEDAIESAGQNASPTTTVLSITALATPVTTSGVPSNTSNVTVPGGNGTYNAAYDLGPPSIDVARELAAQGSLSYWSDLFTPGQYDMYRNDPICFYANIESIYISGSPQWTSSISVSVDELYGTAHPDHLYSVHFATPSPSGSVTATRAQGQPGVSVERIYCVGEYGNF